MKRLELLAGVSPIGLAAHAWFLGWLRQGVMDANMANHRLAHGRNPLPHEAQKVARDLGDASEGECVTALRRLHVLHDELLAPYRARPWPDVKMGTAQPARFRA